MNRKLIAAAVSAAVIAPVAAQAGEVTLYGNITNAISFDDADVESTSLSRTIDGTTTAELTSVKESTSGTNMVTVSSRIGVKASSDLGNGMTASGQYEFSTNTDDKAEGIDGTRIATVGLSGSFGSVTLGQQWSTYFNTIGTLVSPNYSVYVPHGSPLRTANTIQYTNSFGPIALGIDVRVDDDEPYKNETPHVIGGEKRLSDTDGEGSGTTIGLTINPMDNLTVGVVFDKTDEKENEDKSVVSAGNDSIGIAAKMTFGNLWGSVGYQKKENDKLNATDIYGGIESAVLGTSVTYLEEETEYTQLWLGANLGENTTLAIGYGKSENPADFGIETRSLSGSFDGEMDTEHFAVALNHKLGGGFHLFAEYMDTSTEGSVSGTLLHASDRAMDEAVDIDLDSTDTSKIVVGMRINF